MSGFQRFKNERNPSVAHGDIAAENLNSLKFMDLYLHIAPG